VNIDVQRSFTNLKDAKEFDQEILKELLKAYSMYDAEISYCQGMNYSMGLLYLYLGDPNVAFRAFQKTMDTKLRILFENEFSTLKKYFFKFTRILELFLPDLAAHFAVYHCLFILKFRLKRLSQVIMFHLGSSQFSHPIFNIQ
jgi:hypothetical protein